MIKGVVFDLDHTLFDRYKTLRTVLPEMYRCMRDKIPEDLSLQDFIEKFIAVEKQHIYGGWTYTGDRMVEDGIFLEGTTGAEVWFSLYTYCWPIAAVEFPFTKPTLEILREMGMKIGIVTNGTHDMQMSKIELLALENYVDEIVISGDVGAQKPDTKPFLVLSEKIGIAPENLIYVGDNPLNDVDASRNAGYTPVWVKTVNNWYFKEVKHPDFEIDTIAEIPQIVEKLNRA